MPLTNSSSTPAMAGNVSNHINAGLESSDKLLSRLVVLRDRISGTGDAGAKSCPPAPAGVLAMASSVQSNITFAHQIIDELEQLIG